MGAKHGFFGPHLGASFSAATLSRGGAGGAFDNFFASDGCSFPWYSKSTYPAALYHAGTNCALVAYQAWDGSSPRLTNLARIDHATGVTTVVLVGDNNIADDSHGNPAVCVDLEGYVHVFYGPHEAAMQWSTSDQVLTASGTLTFHENTAITSLHTGMTTVRYTYPHPLVYSANGTTTSAIRLLMRSRLDGGNNRPLALLSLTPTGSGAYSVGATSIIAINFGDGSRVYFEEFQKIGTTEKTAYGFARFADFDDTFRRDVYAFVFHEDDRDMSNIQNTFTVQGVADYPMTISEADTNFRIIDQSSPFDTRAAHLVVGAEPFAVTIYEMAHLEDTTPGEIIAQFRTYTQAGGWTEFATVLADGECEPPEGAFYLNADGTLHYYYVNDPDSLWVAGGNVYRITRDTGGTWGAPTLIRLATDYPLEGVSRVLDGAANAHVVFHERSADEATEAGDLKMFLWGNGGFKGGALIEA